MLSELEKLDYGNIVDYCPFSSIPECKKKDLALCRGNYGASADYWFHRNEEEVLLEKNG